MTIARLGVVDQVRFLTSQSFLSSKLFISAMRSIVACHFVNVTGRLTLAIIVIITFETAGIAQWLLRIAIVIWFNLHLDERHFSSLLYLGQSRLMLMLIPEL